MVFYNILSKLFQSRENKLSSEQTDVNVKCVASDYSSESDTTTKKTRHHGAFKRKSSNEITNRSETSSSSRTSSDEEVSSQVESCDSCETYSSKITLYSNSEDFEVDSFTTDEDPDLYDIDNGTDDIEIDLEQGMRNTVQRIKSDKRKNSMQSKIIVDGGKSMSDGQDINSEQDTKNSTTPNKPKLNCYEQEKFQINAENTLSNKSIISVEAIPSTSGCIITIDDSVIKDFHVDPDEDMKRIIRKRELEYKMSKINSKRRRVSDYEPPDVEENYVSNWLTTKYSKILLDIDGTSSYSEILSAVVGEEGPDSCVGLSRGDQNTAGGDLTTTENKRAQRLNQRRVVLTRPRIVKM